MGCYDDIEAADAFVLWGSNMAEMHPILWTRVTDRRLCASACEGRGAVDLRASQLRAGGHPIVFKPETDLAILNYIANHIIQTGRVNANSSKSTPLPHGQTDIGYGLRPEHPCRRRRRTPGTPTASKPIDFEDFAKFVTDLHAGQHRASSPECRRAGSKALAELYADPKTKVMSFWTMGFNQHVRGVWANHMIYNIHLLTGKIAEPGNSPFSLTGQPSACGTAREVGTFAHRLPADMVVTNPEHRKKAEEIWKLPAGLLPDKPGYHAVQQDRMLKDGKLNAYWVRSTTTSRRRRTSSNETYPGYRNPDNFIVVSDAYPTVTAMAADSSCRRRCGSRRKAPTATPSAAPTSGISSSRRRERRAPTSGSSWSFPSASRPTRSGRRKSWTQNPRVPRQDAVRRAVRNGKVDRFPVVGDRPGIRERRSQGIRLLRPERAVRGIRLLRARPRHDLPISTLPQGARHALAGGRWQGDAVALPGRPGPLRQGGAGDQVLRQPGRQGDHLRASLTSRPPRPPTRNTTCGW